jgi:hypothetical protein
MGKVVGPETMAERDNTRSSSHFLPCSELEARHTFQEGCEIKVVRICFTLLRTWTRARLIHVMVMLRGT